jgi:uncharacterized protein YjiS (DUF1127 family)
MSLIAIKPITWLLRQYRLRRELDELANMTAYQLKDIGLTKYDAQRILKEGTCPTYLTGRSGGKHND